MLVDYASGLTAMISLVAFGLAVILCASALLLCEEAETVHKDSSVKEKE